ncbi:hypothetical protein AVEN_73736-1 [Araneus ventricosus]|uniref:Uncharacterized protein n=1 Tax=Araneus ventricosus TaxID=182803 RepID=A0A4Y2N9S3_ARAVE|nr:hypothetical protein AVEN_73736-1 [Araneus ventricosus]
MFYHDPKHLLHHVHLKVISVDVYCLCKSNDDSTQMHPKYSQLPCLVSKRLKFYDEYRTSASSSYVNVNLVRLALVLVVHKIYFKTIISTKQPHEEHEMIVNDNDINIEFYVTWEVSDFINNARLGMEEIPLSKENNASCCILTQATRRLSLPVRRVSYKTKITKCKKIPRLDPSSCEKCDRASPTYGVDIPLFDEVSNRILGSCNVDSKSFLYLRRIRNRDFLHSAYCLDKIQYWVQNRVGSNSILELCKLIKAEYKATRIGSNVFVNMFSCYADNSRSANQECCIFEKTDFTATLRLTFFLIKDLACFALFAVNRPNDRNALLMTGRRGSHLTSICIPSSYKQVEIILENGECVFNIKKSKCYAKKRTTVHMLMCESHLKTYYGLMLKYVAHETETDQPVVRGFLKPLSGIAFAPNTVIIPTQNFCDFYFRSFDTDMTNEYHTYKMNPFMAQYWDLAISRNSKRAYEYRYPF